MASKKQKKGKTTISLTDFLASEPKLVTVRGGNWSDIVDHEEAETKPIVVDIGVLPTAPRGSADVDYSTVPNSAPFVAHVANLSFEIDDEGLRRIFGDLNPKTARVMKDGTRSRGVGLVEFDTRESLIEGLKRTDKEVYGRKIRVNVSDKTDSHHQNDNSRGSFGNNRSNRSGGGGEERPEMADRWKRAEPRPDEPSDDRPSSGMNRDRPNRDFGRSSTGTNSRDNQHGNDYGFGYPRARDDRGGTGGGDRGGGRDFNRQGQRNRYQDDDNRSNSGVDRPRYTGRYSDTRDTRDRNQPADETRDDQQQPPRERQRLQLQPRTKPLEEVQPLSGSSSSINNVAAQSSNPDESPSSITIQQAHESSINENRDDYQQQESRESTDETSRVSTSDEQPIIKPSRGAGASIFGGAKPVDTAARELEIEKKLKEHQITSSEKPDGDNEETSSPTRPSINRTGERDVYRAKRTSHNDDHGDRKDDGRSGHGGDYHSRRENNDARPFDDDNRKHNNDDHYRRGGGHDRDRQSGPPRRDHESGRTSKYNHHNHSERDHERGNNNRNRDPDSNEFTQQGRSTNNHFNAESQPRNQQRGGAPRPLKKLEDDTIKVQVSNKFAMLGEDDLDDSNENDDAQSPNIDD